MARRRAFIDGPYRARLRQTIQGDYGPGNTLFLDERLMVVLDLTARYRLHARSASRRGSSSRCAAGRIRNRRRSRAFCHGYGYLACLAAAVAAFPYLVRLRDAVASIRWLGRMLADGNARPRVERIAERRADHVP